MRKHLLGALWLLTAPVMAQGEPPGDPVALVIDDGTVEDEWKPILTPHYLVNRFTPEEFPIDLTEVEIWIPELVQPVHFQLGIFDSDGTQFQVVGEQSFLVETGGEFITVTLNPVVTVHGPGDIMIGLDLFGFPIVGIDTDTSQGRSFYCLAPFEPWQLPCSFVSIDGNWMIRAFGLVAVPVELMSFEVE